MALLAKRKKWLLRTPQNCADRHFTLFYTGKTRESDPVAVHSPKRWASFPGLHKPVSRKLRRAKAPFRLGDEGYLTGVLRVENCLAVKERETGGVRSLGGLHERSLILHVLREPPMRSGLVQLPDQGRLLPLQCSYPLTLLAHLLQEANY